jgi:hypothetical protein
VFYNYFAEKILDIVRDDGEQQLEFLETRRDEFKASAYSHSKAELLIGFHFEDSDFFFSSEEHTNTYASSTAKVQFPIKLGLVKLFP